MVKSTDSSQIPQHQIPALQELWAKLCPLPGLSPKIRMSESLSPNTSACDLNWRSGLYRGNQVKVRLLQWTPIQHDCRPCEKEPCGHRHTHKEDAMWGCRQRSRWCFHNPRNLRPTPTPKLSETTRTGRELGADSPSWPSEGTRPDDTLILDSWSAEPRENKFLLFNPLSLQYFVTAALVN